jgi:hypothetical protein
MEKWRLEHPHDTPPYPLIPSPTFAHSSWRPPSGRCAPLAERLRERSPSTPLLSRQAPVTDRRSFNELCHNSIRYSVTRPRGLVALGCPNHCEPNTAAASQLRLSPSRVLNRRRGREADRCSSQARPQWCEGCGGNPVGISPWATWSRTLSATLVASRPEARPAACEPGQGRPRERASIAWAGATGFATVARIKSVCVRD